MFSESFAPVSRSDSAANFIFSVLFSRRTVNGKRSLAITDLLEDDVFIAPQVIVSCGYVIRDGDNA